MARKKLTRLIKWTCPGCLKETHEEIDFPQNCLKEPNIVECLPLTCWECEKERAYNANRKLIREPEACGRNRVFDRRVDVGAL